MGRQGGKQVPQTHRHRAIAQILEETAPVRFVDSFDPAGRPQIQFARLGLLENLQEHGYFDGTGLWKAEVFVLPKAFARLQVERRESQRARRPSGDLPESCFGFLADHLAVGWGIGGHLVVRWRDWVPSIATGKIPATPVRKSGFL